MDKNLLKHNSCIANQYKIRVESSPSPAPISTYGGLEVIVIGSNGLEHGDNGAELVNSTFLVTQSVT